MAQIHTHHGDNITSLKEYLYDEENISYDDFDRILQTAFEILERCLDTTEDGFITGLIYGHVQSGKTSVILTTIALASDNGFNNFVVMTSNYNDIYEQTLERIKGALDSFQVFGKKEIADNLRLTPGLPSVLVLAKHPKRLQGGLGIVQQSNWQNEPVIIIDDEADQASLDTNINNLTKPTSAVNQAIVDLRHYFNSHTYLQTTATPQALILQDTQSPFRPDFVVVTEPGTGYRGGQHFFGDNDFNNSEHIRTVPLIDVDMLRNSKTIPDTVIQSMLVFFLGAAILRTQGNSKKYTYLLHTSFRQGDHHLAAELVEEFKNQLTNQLRQNRNDPIAGVSPTIRIQLQNAYNDLQQTCGNILPFRDVLAETARRITSTEVREINSDSGQGVKPNPDRKHTLYIGGTKIGRGVTVKNLLVTYYGRDAQQPQMDTVLQHARMYGYRRNELPATRIYLPKHLAQRFVNIHISDKLVREQCQITHLPIHIIPLLTRSLRPTRRNILNENTVTLVNYHGGSLYFPSLPISDPNILGNQTQELDTLLSTTKYPNEQQPYLVTIDELLEILDFKYKVPGASGGWSDDLIRQAVCALRDQLIYQNKGSLVIVNRNADIGRSEGRNGQVGAVLPGNVGNAPYGIDRNFPTLLMTRNSGRTAKGWHGEPFWIPVIRFPNGNYAFSTNES